MPVIESNTGMLDWDYVTLAERCDTTQTPSTGINLYSRDV